MGKSGGSYRTSSSPRVWFCHSCEKPLGENARKRLYVCNLPTCGEEDLREDLRKAFEEYGDIKDVKLIKDRATLKPRGFGFVEYYDLNDAVKARYKMNGEELPGYRYAYISVDYAADKISQGPAPIDSSPESYSTYKRKAKRKSISPRKCNRSGSYSGRGRKSSSSPRDDEPEFEPMTDKSMRSRPTSAAICDGCGRPLVDNASTTLCVHDLDPVAQDLEADLEKAFGRYGHIKKVTLSRDYAFVVYRDISHAAKAREMMNGKIPGHSNSWVDYAEETRHLKSGSVAPIDSSPESYSSYIRYSPHNDAPQSITDDRYVFEDDQPEFE